MLKLHIFIKKCYSFIKVKQYNISSWDSIKANYWGITKAGNTSIKFALLEKEKVSMLGTAIGISQWVHRDNITKYIDQITALTNNYINFTVTRNPYHRALSMYKDFQRRNKIFMKVLDKKFMNVKTFDDFLSVLLFQKDVDRNEHFRTQTFFICKDNTILPQYVFDITEIEKVNEKFEINIPHINRIKSNLILTDNQIKKINEIYDNDFRLLKYSMQI